ncbi:hypothetical protein N7527_004657 [Penicillium freii]|nr:hypothetical protein N7527_004657 [Penicillium freii]
MSTLRYSGLYIGTEVTFATPSPQNPTDSNKKAFMRTYFQIPIAGTESQHPEVRQQQAAPPRKNRELNALKDLRLRQCPVVPTLLAYKEKKQDNDSLVPDGYIIYIVELRGYGWEPVVPGLQNTIYGESTETMHIAGFRNPVPLDPEEKFTDRTFSGWGLAIPPDDADWEEDSTKWAW